jgi:DNA-binding LytR/AlgR family response regulator
MIPCIIIDDSLVDRDELYKQLKQFTEIKVLQSCENVLQAEEFLSQNDEVEVVFLDIDMPSISGIEWIKTLKKPPMTVFVTSHTEYALESFELNTVDYLVKPVSSVRLLKCIHKLKEIMEYKNKYIKHYIEKDEDYFFIKSDGEYVKILFQDLIYMEAVGDFTSFYLKNNVKHFALTPLKQVENYLPKDAFMRVHRSFIVNIKEIDIIGSYELKAKGYTIPFNKNSREELYQKIVANKVIKRKD